MYAVEQSSTKRGTHAARAQQGDAHRHKFNVTHAQEAADAVKGVGIALAAQGAQDETPLLAALLCLHNHISSNAPHAAVIVLLPQQHPCVGVIPATHVQPCTGCRCQRAEAESQS